MCLNLPFEVKNQLTFYKVRWLKYTFCYSAYSMFLELLRLCKYYFYKFFLKWEKTEGFFECSIFFEAQKFYFVFESRLNFFSNGHIRKVVSTLPNVVKIDVENHNGVSTLSDVVQFNVEIHNVVSTLLNVINFKADVHNVVSRLIWRRDVIST